jgi:hypothetical protein
MAKRQRDAANDEGMLDGENPKTEQLDHASRRDAAELHGLWLTDSDWTVQALAGDG